MIIYNVGKVVSRIPVRLNQNHIVKLGIIHGNISVQLIVKACRALCRIVLSDDIRDTTRKLLLDFLLGKPQAMLIVHRNFLSLNNLRFEACKPLFIAKTVIRLALIHKLFCVLHINPCLDALALYIRTISFILIRSFVIDKPCFFKRIVYNFRCALNIALTVRILDTKNEISPRVLCN